jgi:hypothetical protein
MATRRDMDNELRKLSLQALGRLLGQALRRGNEPLAMAIEKEIDRRSRTRRRSRDAEKKSPARYPWLVVIPAGRYRWTPALGSEHDSRFATRAEAQRAAMRLRDKKAIVMMDEYRRFRESA